MPCIIDGNKIIETPIRDILECLQQQLYLKHIDKLRTIEYKQNNARVTCPIHKDGHENTPSCDILLYDKERGTETVNAGTVHCFMAGTKVPTSTGIKNIEELVGSHVSVINGNGDWEDTVFKEYGKSAVQRITLQREQKKKYLYATSSHEWFVHDKNNENGYTLKTTEKLQCNDFLCSKLPVVMDFSLIDSAVQWGIIYADGTRTPSYKTYIQNGIRIKDKSNIVRYNYRINLSKKTDKVTLAKFFNNNIFYSVKNVTLKNSDEFIRVSSKAVYNGDVNMKTDIPDMSYGRDFVMSFLAGYFACDGSVVGKSFSTVNLDAMLKLRDLFVSCGIAIRDMTILNRKPCNTYLKDRESVLYTTKVILETLPDRFFLLGRGSGVNSKKYIRQRWRVVCVEEYTDNVPVFCCETSTKSFVIDENILTHNCFSCGYRANIVRFVADCLNISYKKATEWLLSIIDYSFAEEKRDLGNIDLTVSDEDKDNYSELPVITVDELKKYDFIHPYMFERKLTDEVIEKFDIGYDPESDALTFPVYENGRCLFVAKRRVKFKRFDMPPINPKPIYGLDYISKNEVIICESIINALTCISYGYDAVALFGTGSSYQLDRLNKIGIRSFVLCFDGDEAGRKGAYRFKKTVKDAMISVINMPDGKDANDFCKKDFDELFNNKSCF